MKYYQITDAAKKVNVESHVLRYWEEEQQAGTQTLYGGGPATISLY